MYTFKMSDLEILKSLRRDVLLAAYKSGEGHVPSAYSILEIIFSFYKQTKLDSESNTKKEDLNRFVLSKGHGALALYAVLAEFNFFSKDWVDNFAQKDSRFGGHPDCLKVPGVEASTGSLGHGIGISTGMAYAKKITNSTAKIFCLIGDGELNEGSIWESLLVAKQHKLGNLVVIVDQNHSSDRAINPGSLEDKFKAFGFKTKTLNGNNLSDMFSVYSDKIIYDEPRAIVAETIKGFGLKEMENNPEWHHKTPSESQFNLFMDQLK